MDARQLFEKNLRPRLVAIAANLIRLPNSDAAAGWGSALLDRAPVVALAQRLYEEVQAFEKELENAVPPPAGPDAFHDHLDCCQRCREQPFNLCADGARLLREAATGEVRDGE